MTFIICTIPGVDSEEEKAIYIWCNQSQAGMHKGLPQIFLAFVKSNTKGPKVSISSQINAPLFHPVTTIHQYH